MSRASEIEQRRQEDVCAAVAASVLGARFRRRDENGGQQIHDFDLLFEDGAVEALEVCSFTDATVREQWNAVDALDELAHSLPSSWTIGVGRSVRITDLPSRAESHIAVLEKHGRARFVVEEDLGFSGATVTPDLRAAFIALTNLGVRDALRAPDLPGEPARVMVAAGVGGAGTSALINRAVQGVAFKRDNRLKLQAARQVRHRHIFVPVNPTAGPTWSLVRGDPPAAPPRLPSSVDVAWVVGANGQTLCVTLPGPWEAVAVDAEVWDNPDAWRADE